MQSLKDLKENKSQKCIKGCILESFHLFMFALQEIKVLIIWMEIDLHQSLLKHVYLHMIINYFNLNICAVFYNCLNFLSAIFSIFNSSI